MPVTQTFAASRNATWAPILNYRYDGPPLPLAGATVAMQLRLFPGQPGPAQLKLDAIQFVDSLTGGFPGRADEKRQLSLSPTFTPEQLSALPKAGELGSSISFSFDILITYADGISEILALGDFIVSPGVTIA